MRCLALSSYISSAIQTGQDHQYQSIGYQVECKYGIARALSEQGKEQEALILTREAIALSKTRDSDTEIEGPLDSFDEIKKDLEKLLEELSKKLSSK